MVKLFVEGGGDNDSLKTECRRGFNKLLTSAGFQGRMPRIVACGGRRNAYEQFCTALGEGDGVKAFLLVDAEEPVTATSPWDHVLQRKGDGWIQPATATVETLHLMAQCMEAWLLADRQSLKKFYGQGFNENALPPPGAAPETVAKLDLFQKLEKATHDAKTKGAYGKGKHSFQLLAMIDPSLLRKASPWADRFFKTLDASLV